MGAAPLQRWEISSGLLSSRSTMGGPAAAANTFSSSATSRSAVIEPPQSTPCRSRFTLRQARTISAKRAKVQLDDFTHEYNHGRPHRELAHRATPATIYGARPTAVPGQRIDTHDRVRTDRIDQAGVITVRIAGRLHHIGVGRTYTGTRVLILIQDLNIRIINAATGELLRELTLDPTRDYQPTGTPKAPNGKSSEPNAGSEPFRCLATSHWSG